MGHKVSEPDPGASARRLPPARRFAAARRTLIGAAVLSVAAAPVLAFSLTVSGAAHTSLPPALEVGNGRVATTTIATSTTIAPSTTIASTTTTTTTTVPNTRSGKETTVVAPIPTVRIEDDKGRKLDNLRTQVTTPPPSSPESN